MDSEYLLDQDYFLSYYKLLELMDFFEDVKIYFY